MFQVLLTLEVRELYNPLSRVVLGFTKGQNNYKNSNNKISCVYPE